MEKLSKRLKATPDYYYIVLLSVLVAVVIIWSFTGLWPWKDNPYNSYAIQANSWLDGHLDIGENRPWLELAIYEGKYYVSFPPFPSYLLLPFAVIWGENTPDGWIALAVLLIGAVYAVKLCEKLSPDKNNIIFYSLFLILSSGLLFVGVDGYVWFIAQSLCFTLSLMSIYYAYKLKPGFSLAFWACAVGCRPMSILYLPVIIYIVWREYYSYNSVAISKTDNITNKIKNIVSNFRYAWIAPLIIAISYMILNYARFGNITEFGHNYLPEFTDVSTGQFNIVYLKSNIIKLLRLPGMNPDSGIIEYPSAEGFALYIATPLFIAVFISWIYRLIIILKNINSQKQELISIILIPILAVAHIIIICLHKTLGGWGFGNRYLLDILPWIFYGLLIWKPISERFDRWLVPLMIWGIILNTAGTIATYNHWI